MQVTFRLALCWSPACQIRDSTTKSSEGITRRQVYRLRSSSSDKKIRLCCSISQTVSETAVLVTALSWWICVCRPNWLTDKPDAVFLPSAVICGEHPAAPVHSNPTCLSPPASSGQRCATVTVTETSSWTFKICSCALLSCCTQSV